MKDDNTVVEEFNEIVNMTVSELEKWLKSDDSQSAGWPKDDGSSESVGHDSGRNIIAILKENPDKDPEKYTEDQISHMRKVVSYCKRHLAQEQKMVDEKSTDELVKTKSYASLKNWGHDMLKAKKGGGKTTNGEQHAGDKRKNEEADTGANKKRETEERKKSQESNDAKAAAGTNTNGTGKGAGGKENGDAKAENGEEEEEVVEGVEVEDDEDDEEDEDYQEDGDEAKGEGDEAEGEGDDGEGEGEKKKSGSGKPSANGPKPGETVSWNWGNGQPEGKVLDVKEDKATIETKRGNEVSRKGDPEDPAVILDTGKSKAIKSAHELN